MTTRRTFIKKVGLATATTAISLPINLSAMSAQKMIHQVYFYLHNDSDVKEFMSNATPMLGRCKDVAKFIQGVPADTAKRDVVDHSFHVACTLFFDSLEAQAAYQVDPLHLEFIEKYSHMWKSVKVYDIAI